MGLEKRRKGGKERFGGFVCLVLLTEFHSVPLADLECAMQSIQAGLELTRLHEPLPPSAGINTLTCSTRQESFGGEGEKKKEGGESTYEEPGDSTERR